MKVTDSQIEQIVDDALDEVLRDNVAGKALRAIWKAKLLRYGREYANQIEVNDEQHVQPVPRG